VSLQVKQAGAWNDVGQILTKQAGAWAEVSEVYHKQAGSWLKVYQNVVEVFLTSGSYGINIANHLSAIGVRLGADVIVYIPNGVVIGQKTVGAAAVDLGDIRPYGLVTLVIGGEVQGRGGIATARSANSAIWSSYPFSIDILSTGAVRGGGGAGGNGGVGGYGDTVLNWAAYRFAAHNSADRSEWVDNTAGAIYWYDQYNNIGAGLTKPPAILAKIGSYYYQKGAYVGWDYVYQIRRGTYASGYGGAAGAGGNGQGHGQGAGGAGSGKTGVNRGGQGGNGGAGGAWGVAGSNGVNGGTGYKYSTTTASVAVAGGGKGLGGSAGQAINTSNGNVQVKIRNAGTINGGLNMTQLAL